MAANLQSRRLASFAKRFLSQITPSNSLLIPSYSLTRSVHVSVYDKNVEENVVEENVQPTVVPDDVISPLSDEYWEPHPETGVFGPATDGDKPAIDGEPLKANGDSVLEEKAFFRPLEDLEIPPPELQGETEVGSTIDKA
ncbi:unnamed protein product [Fraxinus pennsylvanica]|uniref:Uncharacterized protein n=1 Tax=Fraxinus pennsylvanica TaxID=56036 RepID=A0AAD2E4Y2_9LAMI|nr:unnamed protein product [Fraxinus pennsylvanica]